MTREEAKEKLYMEWQKFLEDNVDYAGISEAYKMAFKALLEQEPCEDCISRQAVLAIAGDSCLDLDSYEDTREFCDEIKELPPVTPQPKTGHWIKEETILGGATGWDGRSYQCSECGRSIHLDTVMEDLTDYPYCHCGARMVGSQESEE